MNEDVEERLCNTYWSTPTNVNYDKEEIIAAFNHVLDLMQEKNIKKRKKKMCSECQPKPWPPRII